MTKDPIRLSFAIAPLGVVVLYLLLLLADPLEGLGFIAVIAGWTTTEVGRQPWTIYGLMRTADSVSPSLTGANVLLSLLLYVAVYLIIYPVGLSVMLRLVWRGPAAAEDDAPVVSGRPKSPFEALAPAPGETAR